MAGRLLRWFLGLGLFQHFTKRWSRFIGARLLEFWRKILFPQIQVRHIIREKDYILDVTVLQERRLSPCLFVCMFLRLSALVLRFGAYWKVWLTPLG